MDIQRIAAFSQWSEGGNPAGVVLLESEASNEEMARVAAEVGYSETAFAVAQDGGKKSWRVRYFSLESEVPFCGHATITLGAALGRHSGVGTYSLTLNETTITVATDTTPEGVLATLSSPPTKSRALANAETRDILALFDLATNDLDPRLAPALVHGGADHVVLPLRSRTRLAGMTYDLEKGR